MRTFNKINFDSSDEESLSYEDEFEEEAEGEESYGEADSDEEEEVEASGDKQENDNKQDVDVQAQLAKSLEKPEQKTLEAKVEPLQNKEKDVENPNEKIGKFKTTTDVAIGLKRALLPDKIPTPPKGRTLPSYQVMVDAAILNLNERTGSSITAIKNYILGRYSSNTTESKMVLHIMRYVKKALEIGKLVQVKRSYKFSNDTKKILTKLKEEHTKNMNKQKLNESKKNVKKQAKQTRELKAKTAIKLKPLKETTSNVIQTVKAVPKERKTSKATKVSSAKSTKVATAKAEKPKPAKSVESTKAKSTKRRKSIGTLIIPAPGVQSKIHKSATAAEKKRGRTAKSAATSSSNEIAAAKTAEKEKSAKKK